jgi:hypothetical protein
MSRELVRREEQGQYRASLVNCRKIPTYSSQREEAVPSELLFVLSLASKEFVVQRETSEDDIDQIGRTVVCRKGG